MSKKSTIVSALLLLCVVAVPLVTAATQTHGARSIAVSSGRIVVIWGDPFAPMTVATGTGWEVVRVRGEITSRPDLPGYYTYNTMRLTGRLHVEWTSGNDQYLLDATFHMRTDQPPMMPTTIVPEADSFAIMEMEFQASLTTNGRTTSAAGMAALLAAAPGYFGFATESRTTMVLLYMSPLGSQFVFRWSQTDQSIYGIESSAADRFKQKFIMT